MNKKERLFCYHYYSMRNLKESAIKAGYDPDSAQEVSIKLIQREDIKQLILSFDLEQQKKQIENEVIAVLKRIAFNSLQDSIELFFISEEDAKNKINKLDLFCVSEIKKPKENSLEIKFVDRYRALEKLLEISNHDSGEKTLESLYKALNNSTHEVENGEVLNDDKV